MVIALKGALGGFFIALAIFLLCLGIALIAFFGSGEWKKTTPPKKDKYKGQPIVVKGGRKDAK
jgi:uncharacterized iron-regulated membrane protein